MENLTNVLKAFQSETDRDVFVYTADGVFRASSTGMPHESLHFAPNPFQERAVCDRLEDVTYFNAGNGLVGVIDGSKEGDRDCACALSLLLNALPQNAAKPLTRAEKVKRALSGERLEEDCLPFGAYYMLRLKTEEKSLADLENYLCAVSQKTDVVVTAEDKSLIYLKECDFDGDEYRSASEFASVLYDSILEELPVQLKIAVGGVAHDCKELPDCYRQTEFAMKLGLATDKNNGVYGYKEYALVKMLEEFPPSVLTRYYDMLVDKEFKKILADDELIDTAEAFFKNSLNVSETGRGLYLHRNTLMYRLDKIEKATGLNIRRFSDALTFRVALILSRLIAR